MVKKLFCCFICLFVFFAAGCVTAKKEQAQSKLSLKQTVKETGYRVIVYFDVSSDELTLFSKDALMRVAKLQAISETQAYLTGYADKTGNPENNIILSKNRVESAKNFLLSLGVKENNIHIDYKGDEYPVDNEDTPEAYSKNRRVEILLTAAADSAVKESAKDESNSAAVDLAVKEAGKNEDKSAAADLAEKDKSNSVIVDLAVKEAGKNEDKSAVADLAEKDKSNSATVDLAVKEAGQSEDKSAAADLAEKDENNSVIVDLAVKEAVQSEDKSAQTQEQSDKN
ncbi:MAG: OmpA family protein [Endomicrobium sp.]|jgi:uncharacterized protein YkvS|nr:OmpA family protein [Endomicrobium sp.]